MRTILSIILFLLTFSCFAQKNNTKKETTNNFKEEFDFTDTVFYPGQYKIIDFVVFSICSTHPIRFPNNELGSLKLILENYPNITVRIEVHTDFRGDSSYNDTLSFRRAKSIFLELLNQSIEPENIIIAGYGEQHPRILKDGYTFPVDFPDKQFVGISFSPSTVLTRDYILSLESRDKREAAHLLNRRVVFFITSVK